MENLDIVRAALEKCMSIYDEAAKEAELYAKAGSGYGSFPEAMLIKYGEGHMKEMGYQMTDIRKIWHYTKGNLTETDRMREQITKPISGMFFREARAEFAIDAEEHCVYLSCYFGPRYARGFRYKIEKQENFVTLCEEKILWLS